MSRRARILLAGHSTRDSAATLEAAHHVVQACAQEQAVSAIDSFRPDLVVIDSPADGESASGSLIRRLHAS